MENGNEKLSVLPFSHFKHFPVIAYFEHPLIKHGQKKPILLSRAVHINPGKQAKHTPVLSYFKQFGILFLKETFTMNFLEKAKEMIKEKQKEIV